MININLSFLKDFIDHPKSERKHKQNRRLNSFVNYGTSQRYSTIIKSQDFKDQASEPLFKNEDSKPKTCRSSNRRMKSSDSSFAINRNPRLTSSGCEFSKKVFISPAKTDRRVKCAISKVNHYNSKKWMTKHNSRNNDEGYLMNFASEFFKVLDTQYKNKISGKVLLEHLLSLGIATDSLVLKDTLSIIFDCKDIEKIDVNLQDFLSMFRREVVTDLILKHLNESVLVNRKKQKIVAEIHKKMKILGEKKFSIFSNNRRSKLLAKDFIETKKNEEKMITINEHLEVIEELWGKFARSKTGEITVLMACEIFKFFKIFQDNYEAKKYIFYGLGQVSTLLFRDFQQLFAKSMIKGAFVNLSKRLFEGQYAEQEMSPAFKISSYQRALLMSGVKCPNSNISIEEGQMIVKALEKFSDLNK